MSRYLIGSLFSPKTQPEDANKKQEIDKIQTEINNLNTTLENWDNIIDKKKDEIRNSIKILKENLIVLKLDLDKNLKRKPKPSSYYTESSHPKSSHPKSRHSKKHGGKSKKSQKSKRKTRIHYKK
jgi:hypothetical protein